MKYGSKVVCVNYDSKVVCVNDSGLLSPLNLIKKGKIYTVLDFSYSNALNFINLKEFPSVNFSAHRFMLLSEYRKIKLQKLNIL